MSNQATFTITYTTSKKSDKYTTAFATWSELAEQVRANLVGAVDVGFGIVDTNNKAVGYVRNGLLATYGISKDTPSISQVKVSISGITKFTLTTGNTVSNGSFTLGPGETAVTSEQLDVPDDTNSDLIPKSLYSSSNSS